VKTVKHKYHIIPIFFWIGLGLLVMILSYRLGLGGLHNPGPGLMPFLLGCFLSAIAGYFLLAFLSRKQTQEAAANAEEGRIHVRRLCLVLASLFAYALLLEPLGFLITTFLVLVILFGTLENRWSTMLIASLLTALIAYFLFRYLGVQFPKGILRGL
jgi:putative tricarboxylic transport membrane protein